MFVFCLRFRIVFVFSMILGFFSVLGDFFLRPSGSFFYGFRVFWVFFASEEFLVLFLEFYGFLGNLSCVFQDSGFFRLF